jgi:hypothetical protein
MSIIMCYQIRVKQFNNTTEIQAGTELCQGSGLGDGVKII